MPRPDTVAAVVLATLILTALVWPSSSSSSTSKASATRREGPSYTRLERSGKSPPSPGTTGDVAVAAVSADTPIPKESSTNAVDQPEVTAAAVQDEEGSTREPKKRKKKQVPVTEEQRTTPVDDNRDLPSPHVARAVSSATPSRGLDFELPPLPTPLQQLPNKMQHPSKWAGAAWGPVTTPVDWSGAETPLWRRSLDKIRKQEAKFPKHPVEGLDNSDVLYAKHLSIFRALPREQQTRFSVLEVGLHQVSEKRPPFFRFFRQYLTGVTYRLFCKDPVGSSDSGQQQDSLAEYMAGNPSLFFQGDTTSPKDQGAARAKFETADIIVGRAADGISGQLEAFRYFFVNMLKPGGVYFIEDIDMNFIPNADTEECVKTRTLMIDYLRDMISAQINHDWYMRTAGQYRADPFVNNWVQDISCSRGSCVVTKKLTPFNRYANLVHTMPMNVDYQSKFRRARPPPLSSLVNRDPHPNTAVSHYGPMLRPVKLGSPGGSGGTGGAGRDSLMSSIKNSNKNRNLGGAGRAGGTFSGREEEKRRYLRSQPSRDQQQELESGPQAGGDFSPTGAVLPFWAIEANIFKEQSDRAGSDKCAAIVNGHQYHAMYSKVFAPWRAALARGAGGAAQKKWKMLEVGIGCDTQGDPAGGYRLYKQYIPNVEYNAFEFKWSLCVTKFKRRPHIRDNMKYLSHHVHQGDQSNYDHLSDCIRHFGTFDLIVDDGSHVSSMQISTFRELFIGGLKPGGVFVLEDIQTSFMAGSGYGQAPANQIARLTAVDILRDMIVSLNYPSWKEGYDHKDSLYRADEPVMNWVEDIMCSREACAIQKRLVPLSSGWTGQGGEEKEGTT